MLLVRMEWRWAVVGVLCDEKGRFGWRVRDVLSLNGLAN